MVIIITGPIGSGKTTQLEEWVKTQKNIGGILMPVRSGKRFFFNISSGEEYPAEADDKETDIIGIGKFRFSARSFNRANGEILNSFENFCTVIIDEIGPLELNGKGFAPVLRTILEDKNRLNEIDLILVIREGMVEPVTDHFKIIDFDIVSSTREIKKKAAP